MLLADRINSFRELGTNWNGYGAAPLSESLIDRALKISAVFENAGFIVTPTARNSIQFEKESGDVYFEFEVFETREEHYISI